MEQAVIWIVGAVGVPLVNWLKKALGLEGKKAVTLTIVMAFVLGAVALFINGDFVWAAPTFETVASVFGQVLAAATIAYKYLGK